MKFRFGKFFALLLVVTLFMATAVVCQASAGKAYFVDVQQKHDRLNVHAVPANDVPKAHIPRGTVVMHEDTENGWWYVQYRDANGAIKDGYVDSKYLHYADSSVKFECVDNLYLHSRSNIEFGHCAEYHTGVKLPAGTKVTVTAQDGTWSRVTCAAGEGWVASIYLRKAN